MYDADFPFASTIKPRTSRRISFKEIRPRTDEAQESVPYPSVDRDTSTVNARDDCAAHSTAKREMENYIHPEAITEAYQANGIEVTLPATFADFDDVPLIVAQALHATNSPTPWDDISQEKQKKKVSKAKKVINCEATRRMSLARLNECGGYDEVLAWLQNIGNLIDT